MYIFLQWGAAVTEKWPFKTLSAEMAATLYDQHHEGVLIVNQKGILVYYNRRMAQLDNLKPDEIVGRHILDAYHLDENNCMSTKCLITGRPILNVALFYRAIQGDLVNAICNAYPIFEGGKLKGSICYTAEYTSLADRLDITARNYARHPYSKIIDDEHTQNAANGAFHTFASITGDSVAMKAALETARVGAKTTSSVLIYGETGTGKELFAQAIHNHSPRRAQMFCPINCAAIPENLLEGILFGTVKGAFTGALERKGLFELANGGTLFLDELQAMPPGLQSKLLRVVQERRLRRVGSHKETNVDLKIISAVNLKPDEAIERGLLRPDLFYRLGVVLLPLPPLRLRADDIPELVTHFVTKYNKRFRGKVHKVEPEFLDIMKHYQWPGNVRELEHVVETSMNFAVSDPLNDRSLGIRHIQSSHLRKFLVKRKVENETVGGIITAQLPHKNKQSATTLAAEIGAAERQKIMEILAETNNNISQSARQLGLSRQTLYYKLKKYKLIEK